MNSATSAGAAMCLNYAATLSSNTSQLAGTAGLKLGPVGSIIFIVLAGVFFLTSVIGAVILLKEISEW